ncbi:MAG: ABC transporter substrate-binding protein [Oliverpabstia sp.]
MKKFIATVLAVSMVAGSLAGCGGSKESVSSETKAAAETTAATEASVSAETASADAGEPVYGGTLKIAINGNISAQSLDPYYIDSGSADQIVQNYGDTLILNNDEGNAFVPNIATDWAVSEDGLEYTFHIRDDVYFQPGKFQDGRKLTTEDVAYSLLRSKGYWCNYLPYLKDVQAEDDKTVVCTLEYANATFLYQLTHSSTVMVCKEEVEGWGEDYGMHVVGTGAFQVVEHIPEQSTKLVRNGKYWGPKPYLDGIEYVNIRDDAQAVNALLTGEIDMAVSLSAEGCSQVRQSENVVLCQRPYNRVAEFGFNTKDPVLSDIRVREALIKAVDYEQLAVGTFTEGTGTPNRVPLPQTSWGYSESMNDLIPAYDPEGAKALLAEAGYSNGLTLDLTTDGSDESIRSATILEAFLSQVGVTLNVKTASTAEITEQFQNGTFQIFRRTQGGSADPATFIGYFFNSEKLHTNYNAWGYSDEETDKLINQALAETDQSKRIELYNQIMDRGCKENVGIFFASLNLSFGVNSKVHGYIQQNNAVLRVCGPEGTNINIWKEQ